MPSGGALWRKDHVDFEVRAVISDAHETNKGWNLSTCGPREHTVVSRMSGQIARIVNQYQKEWVDSRLGFSTIDAFGRMVSRVLL